MASPSKAGCQPWAVKLASEGKQQGLPVEKIRQKLVLEGLDPDLISPVLESASTPRCMSPGGTFESFPPRSPKRQIPARKFHDMLSQGVPSSSVRQKMAMEGCSPEDINSFFAHEAEGRKAVQET